MKLKETKRKQIFLTHNQGVPGSSPGGPTVQKRVSDYQVRSLFSFTNIFSFSYVYLYVKQLLYLIAFLSVSDIHAQEINNAVTYRNIAQTHYVRHIYDNDFFTKTDKYYTQGINMETVTPTFSTLPTKHILFNPNNWEVKYGLSLQHNAYTPTSITDTSIRYSDHPYASALMFQAFTISTNKKRADRITTMLSIGVIGKIAGGQWMQETIHRNLDNAMPQGWKYQVANDVVINYRFFYEKQLLRFENILEINATAITDAGTLNTGGSLGANFILGYFESAYKSNTKKISAFAYAHTELRGIGYDAMLEGGIFNPNSIHTIPASDVERFVATNRLGVILRYRGVQLEYFQTYRTRRFIKGDPHAWGGVLIGVGF